MKELEQMIWAAAFVKMYHEQVDLARRKGEDFTEISPSTCADFAEGALGTFRQLQIAWDKEDFTPFSWDWRDESWCMGNEEDD